MPSRLSSGCLSRPLQPPSSGCPRQAAHLLRAPSSLWCPSSRSSPSPSPSPSPLTPHTSPTPTPTPTPTPSPSPLTDHPTAVSFIEILKGFTPIVTMMVQTMGGEPMPTCRIVRGSHLGFLSVHTMYLLCLTMYLLCTYYMGSLLSARLPSGVVARLSLTLTLTLTPDP